MTEKSTEVTVHRVEYVCDACGEGVMRSVGQLPAGNTGHVHVCLNCGAQQVFNDIYPKTVYQPK